MTPYDQIFKILHRFKGYQLTPEQCTADLIKVFTSYPGFTPGAIEDFLKFLSFENREKGMEFPDLTLEESIQFLLNSDKLPTTYEPKVQEKATAEKIDKEESN